MQLRLLGLTALVAVLLVPLPAAAGGLPQLTLSDLLAALDEGPGLPEAWGGIWDTDAEFRVCDSQDVFFSWSSIDTLCPGDIANPGETDPTECTGTATATTVDMTCTYSQVEDGCTINSVVDYDATLDGDSYTGVFRIQSTPVGECPGQGDECIEMTITGTRVGPAPASCATPVEPSTWGTLKSRYE